MRVDRVEDAARDKRERLPNEVDPRTGATSQALQPHGDKAVGHAKALGSTCDDRTTVVTAALPVKCNALRITHEVDDTVFDGSSPGRGRERPESGFVTKGKALPSQPPSVPARGNTLSSRTQPHRTPQEPGMTLLRPGRAVDSPPTAPRTKNAIKPGDRSSSNNRGPQGVSKLRAPGWGRDAAIKPIPPAPSLASVTKIGVSSATATSGAAVRVAATHLPWDLLTPVTEAATVEEQSLVSYGARCAATVTPASSKASRRSKPERGASSDTTQNSSRHGRLRYPRVAAPGACRGESPAETAGTGYRIRRSCKKRATWGVGSAGSDHSTPRIGAARSVGRDAVSSLRSPSAPRGATDRVCMGGASFSSRSAEGRSERQSQGGYVAALGRRERSVARCEAARRLTLIARATEKARPSTPIAERAPWGKGRETRVEAERKTLLQRRLKYAERLQRNAKVR